MRVSNAVIKEILQKEDILKLFNIDSVTQDLLEPTATLRNDYQEKTAESYNYLSYVKNVLCQGAKADQKALVEKLLETEI